jgi:hypothetical protein
MIQLQTDGLAKQEQTGEAAVLCGGRILNGRRARPRIEFSNRK